MQKFQKLFDKLGFELEVHENECIITKSPLFFGKTLNLNLTINLEELEN